MAYNTAVMPGQTTLQQQQPPAYGLLGANRALAANPYAPMQTPQTGLTGVNNALSVNTSVRQPAGTGGLIDYNRNLAMQQGQNGINSLNGYVQPGLQANQLQAALSGTLGQQAQQQAYNNFQSSPGQQWLQQQAERGVLRNSAAIGGLGGGNVRQELQRQAMGMAQQDFQNQFNNAGMVADRGMQGANLQNNLYNMMGNAATSAGAQHAGVMGAQIGASASTASAAMAAQTALARDKAQYAFQAGQDIANNYGSTTSALAQLAAQQGQGIAGINSAYTGNLAQLLAGGGANQATSNQNWAALLANLASGAGGQAAGLPGLGGATANNGMANMGGLLQGAGAAWTAFSDRRLKTNIRRLGTTRGGNNLYAWDWNEEGARLAGNQPEFGVIAQEINQDAVIVGPHGYLMVDYARVL